MNNSSPKIVGFVWREVSPKRSRVLPARFVLRLQQTVGNQAVVRLLAQSLSSAHVLGQTAETLKKERTASRLAGLVTAWRRLLRTPAPS